MRALRPSEQSPEVQKKLWEAAGLNPAYKVSGVVTGEVRSVARSFTTSG